MRTSYEKIIEVPLVEWSRGEQRAARYIYLLTLAAWPAPIVVSGAKLHGLRKRVLRGMVYYGILDIRGYLDEQGNPATFTLNFSRIQAGSN